MTTRPETTVETNIIEALVEFLTEDVFEDHTKVDYTKLRRGLSAIILEINIPEGHNPDK